MSLGFSSGVACDGGEGCEGCEGGEEDGEE